MLCLNHATTLCIIDAAILPSVLHCMLSFLTMITGIQVEHATIPWDLVHSSSHCLTLKHLNHTPKLKFRPNIKINLKFESEIQNKTTSNCPRYSGNFNAHTYERHPQCIELKLLWIHYLKSKLRSWYPNVQQSFYIHPSPNVYCRFKHVRSFDIGHVLDFTKTFI